MLQLKLKLTLVFSSFVMLVFSQFKNPNNGGFTLAIQVDSSHYFLVGGVPTKSEKTKFVNEERSMGYTTYYTGENVLWSNAYVFNDSTDRLIKVFDMLLMAVFPAVNTMSFIKYDYNYQKNISSGTSKDNLIFAVKTDSYNNDGVIDMDDPVYIFISRKDGTGCKQISPVGMNVTNWKLIKGGSGILLTIQPDKNADKKFTEEEELYQIDLNEDISKIKIKAVQLK